MRKLFSLLMCKDCKLCFEVNDTALLSGTERQTETDGERDKEKK